MRIKRFLSSIVDVRKGEAALARPCSFTTICCF